MRTPQGIPVSMVKNEDWVPGAPYIKNPAVAYFINNSAPRCQTNIYTYVYLRILMNLEEGRYVIEASFSSRHLRRLTNDVATGPRKCSETTKKKRSA